VAARVGLAPVGIASLVVLVTGAISGNTFLLIAGFALFVAVSAMAERGAEPRPRWLAAFALFLVIVTGVCSLAGAVLAIFVGFAKAFGWVAVFVPAAAVWFLVSEGIRRLGRQSSGSSGKSLS
jgi:hypothetical protein